MKKPHTEIDRRNFLQALTGNAAAIIGECYAQSGTLPVDTETYKRLVELHANAGKLLEKLNPNHDNTADNVINAWSEIVADDSGENTGNGLLVVVPDIVVALTAAMLDADNRFTETTKNCVAFEKAGAAFDKVGALLPDGIESAILGGGDVSVELAQEMMKALEAFVAAYGRLGINPKDCVALEMAAAVLAKITKLERKLEEKGHDSQVKRINKRAHGVFGPKEISALKTIVKAKVDIHIGHEVG